MKRAVPCTLARWIAGGMVALLAGSHAAETNQAQRTEAASVPRLTISACPQAPVVDGVLDDPCWQADAAIKSFFVMGDQAGTVPQPVWLTYDAAWLYLAFAVPHPLPREIRQSVRQTDGPVNTDDSIEVFLDPGSEGAIYFHLMLNAGNVRSSKSVAKDLKRYVSIYICDLWQSATRITDTGWNAEMGVPLALLARSGDVTRLRLNVARNLVVPTLDDSHARVNETVQYSTWAPLQASFHEADHFGYVVGLPAQPQTAFCPRIESLQVSPFVRGGEGLSYGIEARISDYYLQSGNVTMVARDYPVAGVGSSATTSAAIAAGLPQTVTLRMPAQDMSARSILVQLCEQRSGSVFQAEWLEGSAVRVLEPLTAYADRSHYATETTAVIVCAVNVPPADYAELRLAVRTSAGRQIAATALAGEQTRVAVPVAEVAMGVNTLTVELIDGGGAAVAARSVTLVRVAPPAAPAHWQTDRVNGVLLHAGEPFFPFGMVCTSGLEPEAEREAVLGELAAAGFNSLARFDFNGTPERTRGLLESAERHGLAVIDNLDAYHAPEAPDLLTLRGKALNLAADKHGRQAFFDAGYRANLPYILAGIRAAKTSPALLGFFTLDEPSSGDSVDMYRWGRDLYLQTQSTDGAHPTFINFSSQIPAGDEWTDWCDVLLTDPYWWPAGIAHRGTPNYVSQITWLTVARGRSIHKPTMIIPLAETWGCNPKRGLTPGEQFCQTYLALIHGAKGLLYNRYPVHHQSLFLALSELAAQVRQMAPALLAPAVAYAVTYTPPAGDPAQGNFPDVQVRLCRWPGGDYLLLAANSRDYPVAATYRLAGLPDGRVVRQCFAASELTVSEQSFAERLPPYATRAYRLTLGATETTTPMALTVLLKPFPDEALAEAPAIMFEGRPDRKNILPNPGFEQATLAGMPDYVWPFDTMAPTCRWGMATYPLALDPVNPFEGKVSLRLTTTGGRHGVHLKLAPKVERPEPFVFSVYMRGDSSAARIDMPTIGWGWESPRPVLTTQWQRYVIQGNIPPGLSYYDGVRFLVENGTVWVDAMQLERGTEATVYEP